MITVQTLKEFGANTEEGIKRCVNNEGFYLNLVKKFLLDENVYALKDALLDGDLDKAFEKAHSLKGILSNLAITPLEKTMVEITEGLRIKKELDYLTLLDEYMQKFDELKALNE